MTTDRTPRFVTALNASRRIAAGLSVALTVMVLAGVGELADQHYDDAVAAAADSRPTQVVHVTAKRLPRV
ncbi:hypothetical protein [Ideonella sp.]|uniref:hypothetical protein n=1 Tax=Ideonella sp. TaxID=1929293 RepID=UPI0035B3C95B